jgi:hypothetical protein
VNASRERLRKAVGDPSILPTTLSARFVVLCVLILASTASVYGYLGLRLADAGETRAAGCLAGSGLDELRRIQPGDVPGLIGRTTPVVTCVAPDLPLIVWSSLGGLVLVVGVALVAYAIGPRRPRGLLPLRQDHAAAAAEVDRLVSEYGLVRRPAVWVDPLASDSRVGGTEGRPLLFLDRATVRAYDEDMDRFRATVLHELAHLRNRDVRPTRLATTAWRSFLALAVVPYVGLLVLDVIGRRQKALDDLHTTLAIAAMVVLVLLTRRALLRDRELGADATAGRYDDRGLLARRLALSRRPIRRPVFLRTHPTAGQRRQAIAEPWNLPPLSFAQFAAAGIGLSVLSQDAGTFAWQALLAAGFEPVPGPQTTFVLIAVAAIANLGPIGALAWLVGAATWRGRVRQLVAPTRSSVFAPALGLGVGMIMGEPASVSAANASHWGVFDGVGDGSVGTAVVAVLVLVAILAALSRWSWDNAGAWLPAVRGSLRRASGWSAAIGAVAVLPWYATWWSMHDEPMIGRAYAWDPGFAEALGYRYVSLPAGEWLQISYVPGDMLAWAPGVVVLTALPVLVTVAGLVRRRTPSTPLWVSAADAGLEFRPPDHRPPLARAVLVGAAGAALVLAAGTALAWAGYAHLAGLDRLNGADHAEFLHYLTAAATVLTSVVAAAAAAVTTLTHRSRSVVLGLVSALIVGCVGAIAAPAMIGVARCGPVDLYACQGDRFLANYRVLLGLTGTAMPVKAIVAGLVVAGGAAAIRRSSPVAERPATSRPATVLVLSGAASVVLLLTAATWFNLSW